MKTLMTPAEVVAMAFEPTEVFSESAVTGAVIAAAGHKFIKPVLGELYERLLDGLYPDLAEEYIKPPLALYVKWMLMPALAVQSGRMGVVQLRGGNFTPADRRDAARARRRIKADALALMRCATEHIEENLSAYPSYDAKGNILNSGSSVGNIIL